MGSKPVRESCEKRLKVIRVCETQHGRIAHERAALSEVPRSRPTGGMAWAVAWLRGLCTYRPGKGDPGLKISGFRHWLALALAIIGLAMGRQADPGE